MIEDEQYTIEMNDEGEENKTLTASKFPVKTQLLLIAFIMFAIFGSFIVPKVISFIATDSNPSKVVATAITNSTETETNLPQKIEDVEIKAEAAYVWDVVGQRVLFQKNADETLPLASITKLMTALVAYELVPDDTLVTISETAAAQQSGGTLQAGEVFKAKELADFALISSYNSAAYTLADSVGKLLGDKEPVTQFIAAMNIKASELNLQSLNFANPTGLDISTSKAGAYGNARDVSFLMEYIVLNYPQILTPTVTKNAVLYNKKGERHEAHNTNNILTDIPNLLGSKTGYTDLAGGNLTIVFDAGYNRPIIITVLGSTWSERFSDVKKILEEVQKTMSNKK